MTVQISRAGGVARSYFAGQNIHLLARMLPISPTAASESNIDILSSEYSPPHKTPYQSHQTLWLTKSLRPSSETPGGYPMVPRLEWLQSQRMIDRMLMLIRTYGGVSRTHRGFEGVARLAVTL
ncbi:hypothetical protein BC628DRAFT_1345564 [Trametes gibbosa]|nr:hypothetical protein BC628DRAFT_1345564 [Trametes gibbosa]